MIDFLNPAAWNAFVREESGSPLQSWEWGVFQETLGKKIVRVADDDFVALFIWQTLPFHRGYWYAPRGPVVRRNTDLGNVFEKFRRKSAERLAKEPERAISIRVEPDYMNAPEASTALQALGFTKANPVQPHETRILDLKNPEVQLLKEMEHDTRYAIRTAERRSVTVRLISDKHDKQNAFDVFWDLFEETAKRHDLKNYPENYYRELFALYGDLKTVVAASYLEKTPINASIILLFGKEAIYLYSASRTGYGRYNAPSLALWKAIQFAKADGRTKFDLWGVSREKSGWKGITSFKEGFGGTQIREPGAWDYPINKFFYHLYRSLTKLPH
mgnify:FL=1